jgi:hypothetical protein
MFPHYLINGMIFEKKERIELKMFVLIFSTDLSETSLILRRNGRDIIKMYIGLNVKCRRFVYDLNET